MNQFISISMSTENVDFSSLRYYLSDIHEELGYPETKFPGYVDRHEEDEILLGYCIEVPNNEPLDEYIILSAADIDHYQRAGFTVNNETAFTTKEKELIHSGHLELQQFIHLQCCPTIQKIYREDEPGTYENIRHYTWQEFEYILAKLMEFCEPDNSTWIYQFQSFNDKAPIFSSLVEKILDYPYPKHYGQFRLNINPSFLPQWYAECTLYSH